MHAATARDLYSATHLGDKLLINIYARARLIFPSFSLVQYLVLLSNVMPQIRALSSENFRKVPHDVLT
jgi:hypothetical protein